MAAEKFVCRQCADLRLAAKLAELEKRHRDELDELRARQRAEVNRTSWQTLFPLFAQQG
jgi:hypothetical protein